MKGLRVYGLLLLFFVLLAAIVFRCGWGSDMVFSGSDMNIGILTLNHRMLPQQFTGGYYAAPLLGEAGSTPITFTNFGKALLSPSLFSDTWYALILIISSLFLIAYLRLWKLHWMSCTFGALSAFWVGSITLATAGHIYKLGVMAFFSVSLYLLELSVRSESRRRQIAFAMLTGLSVGLMLLEQQDVGLLAGLFLGSYAFFRLIGMGKHDRIRWVTVLLPIALVALPLIAPTALKAYSKNVTQAGVMQDPEARWNFVTQWSMVPSEWPELIAPGYTGWYTGHPEFPYWGVDGQSPEWKETGKGFRNFRLDSLYLGVLPVGFAILGLALASRRLKSRDESSPVFLFWGILAIVALLLSFGKFSLLYKGFYHLPLVGNIRVPVKFLHDFQTMVGIVAAFGVDRALFNRTDDSERILKWSMGFSAGLAVTMAVAAAVSRLDFMELRFQDWGEKAPAICEGISRAWLHASAMALLLFLATYLVKKKKVQSNTGRIGVAFVLLAAVVLDSVYLTNHYFKAIDISDLRRGNILINYLKEHQGNERICFADQSGVYNSWMGLEVSYNALHTFNFWQMPRMPDDYKNYLEVVGSNQIRLWQLASVKYVTAPASIVEQFSRDERLKSMFTPVMYYRFVLRNGKLDVLTLDKPEYRQDQVLLRLDVCIPRFSLYYGWQYVPLEKHCSTLVSNDFDPLKSVLVDSKIDVQSKGSGFVDVKAKTSIKDAVVETNSENAGILMFTQRYQVGWHVTIDGKPAELMRCNYLCMGVLVPSGKHEVRFKYK